MGYTHVPNYKFKWAFITLSAIVAVSISPIRLDSPIQVFSIVTNAFLTLPTIVFGWSNEKLISHWTPYIAISYCLVFQIIIKFISKLDWHLTNFTRIDFSKYYLPTLFFITFTLIITIITSNLDFRIVSASEIYKYRDEYLKHLTLKREYFISYSLALLGGFYSPALLIIGLFKSKTLYLLGLLSTFIVYGYAHQKLVIGLAIFMHLFYIFARCRKVTNTSSIFVPLLSAIFIGIVSYELNFFDIYDFLFRRSFVDPSQMLLFYTDFSLHNRSLGLSNTLIWKIFDSSHFTDYRLVISNTYPEIGTNPTSSLIGEAIIQGKIFMVTAIALFASLFFKLLPNFKALPNKNVVFLLSTLGSFLLVESSFLTALVSKGLLLLPLMVYFIP